jgi:uncharacterized protein YukE/surface antigen
VKGVFDMAGNVNHLDTINFNDTISSYAEHILQYEGIVKDVNNTTSAMLDNWKGKGRNAFEKDCLQVQLNLKDISEIMYDMRDALINALAEYISSDLALAKNFESSDSNSGSSGGAGVTSDSNEAPQTPDTEQASGSISRNIGGGAGVISGGTTNGNDSTNATSDNRQNDIDAPSGANTDSGTAQSQIIGQHKFESLLGQTISSVGDANSQYYWGNGNISHAGGYDGQCTWYAYGRFWEKTGIQLNSAYHANIWLSENASDPRVSVNYGADKIQSNSIAVSTTGKWGHVMFIEDVTYNADGKPYFVYFTESNAGYFNSEGAYVADEKWGAYNAGNDCVLQRMSYEDFIDKREPSGYITKR